MRFKFRVNGRSGGLILFVLAVSILSRGSIAKESAPASKSQVKEQSKAADPSVTQNLSRGFFQAARNGKIDMVQVVLNSGFDPDSRDIDGRTALIIAAERGDLEMAKALISAGADKDATFSDSKANGQRRTALQAAETAGKVEVSAYLRSLK